MQMALLQQVLADLCNDSTGVVLTTPAKVRPWIEAAPQIEDELGVLLLNPLSAQECNGRNAASISCPAFDRTGQPVVLHVQIIQLGKSHIRVGEPDLKLGNMDGVSLHMTLDARDFDAAAWDQCKTAPVKFALNRLQQTNKAVIRHVWGRTYQSAGKKCAVQEAASIRFHCQASAEGAKILLKESGSCRVYITSLTDERRPDPAYALVWVRLEEHHEIQALIAGVPKHFGYIRGRRGLAVRVLKADLQDAWKVCRPNETFVEPTAMKYLYKLLHTPEKADIDSIRQLAVLVKWRMAPIKRLAPQKWLVGAEEKPDKDVLVLEGHAVRILPVEVRHGPKQQVVIGERPTSSAIKESSNPWVTGPDPWQKHTASGSLQPGQPSAPPGSGCTRSHSEQI